MQFFVEILAHTPIWVWVIFAGLLVLGLSRTQSGARSFISLIIPALVFSTIALAKLALARFEPTTLLSVAAGGIVAVAFVAMLKPARFTERLADGRYSVRGEWMSLLIILAVFLMNYTSAVLAAIAPDIAHSTALVVATGMTNGFSALYTVGRAIAHLRVGKAMDAAATEPAGA